MEKYRCKIGKVFEKFILHLEILIQTGGDASVYDKFDYDAVEQKEAELLQKALSLEAANAPPETAPKVTATPKEQLKRDIKAAALERLEQAVETVKDFENVTEQWDRLDENRERKERYWEICRNNEDYPLEYGEAAYGTVFPKNLNSVIAKQIRRGEFLDAVFDSPYEIQELVTDEYLYKILNELKPEHKELLYLTAIKGLSNTQIADLQSKTDRAVRYMKDTVFRKIRKKMYEYLTSEIGKTHDMTLAEKGFVENYKTEYFEKKTKTKI